MVPSRTVTARVALVFLAGAALGAQVKPALDRALDRAMETQAPEWRLDSSQLAGNGVHYKVWKEGESRIDISFSVHDSPEQAEETLTQTITRLTMSPRPLPGYGDNAYILGPYNESGRTRIYLRRGKTVLMLGAPGEVWAKRVAGWALAEIDRNPNEPYE